MTRRTLGLVCALAVATTVAGVLLAEQVPSPRPGRGQPLRIVSLAPAITDTLFAIGAGPEMVGISDYCNPPDAASRLPRLGTGFSPNYERIAKLEPTLIVNEPLGSQHPELAGLAETHWLPWLSLDDVTRSTEQLGGLTGHPAEAALLASRLRARLAVPTPRSGPRVLLVLGSGFGSPSQFWFARPSSLHGHALQAAGAIPAVPEELPGPASLSLEQVTVLDPDLVLVLSEQTDLRWAEPVLGALRRAIRGRVALIAGRDVLSTGPRILDLVDAMRQKLQ